MSDMQQDTQGTRPAFSPQAMQEVEAILKRYPEEHARRSALIPVLHLAQQEFGGWLPVAAMDYVAELLGIAPIRVYEVATFYTMFNKTPVGRHHVQVCTNISCWLCDSDGIVRALKERLKVGFGETTDDNAFTLTEVECLGACVNAPMMQINDDYYENLTPEKAVEVIDSLK